jgi:hypothetical protein
VLAGRNSRVPSEVMGVKEWVEFGTKTISVTGVCLPSFFRTYSFRSPAADGYEIELYVTTRISTSNLNNEREGGQEQELEEAITMPLPALPASASL